MVKASYGDDPNTQDRYFDDANFEEVGIEKEFYCEGSENTRPLWDVIRGENITGYRIEIIEDDVLLGKGGRSSRVAIHRLAFQGGSRQKSKLEGGVQVKKKEMNTLMSYNEVKISIHRHRK